MSFLRTNLDERFFAHRLRSTSTAGIASAVLALLLFYYRFLSRHVWDWSLLAVGLTFVVIKLSLMCWYYMKD